MELTVHSLSADEPEFLPDFRETLRACKSFWHNQPKPVELFDRAIAIAGQRHIYVLCVSDYGTTGVLSLVFEKDFGLLVDLSANPELN
jgi:hypothetical protein